MDQSGDDPSGAERDRRSTALVTALGYGVTSRFALFGMLPYTDNELTLTTGGERVTRTASGVGHLTLFGRYTIYQQDRPGRTWRIAPFAGVKAPTGEDDASDTRGRLPPDVQVDSGSWDVLAGAVTTYQTLRYQLDGQLAFQAHNEANGFEAGDIVRLDGSLQYRLRPRVLGPGVPAFVYSVVELNLIHQGKHRVGGARDPDSGGTRWFLTPGIQYVTKRWIAEAAVQLPVSQDLNGMALETDYVARARGVAVQFLSPAALPRGGPVRRMSGALDLESTPGCRFIRHVIKNSTQGARRKGFS